MIFIIGGEGSGQEAYAKKHFPGARVIGNYHLTVKKDLEEGADPLARAEAVSEEAQGRSGQAEELVIWSCEIGCGVVPVSAFDREWREASGRVNCCFAGRADLVVRMVCGAGQVIKGVLPEAERRERGTAPAAEAPVRETVSAAEVPERRTVPAAEAPEKEAGPGRARAVMIAGTMSNAGKSLIAAGLCRIFTEDGYRTAPFKAQNMALNSYVTREGGEMGRSQAVQAAACRREPDARMNPVLLKPTTDRGSQVIVLGHPAGVMEAKEYYRHKKDCLPYVMRAYDSLAAENDIIVLEGAGSPAEINLKDNDIVNLPMAAAAGAPVILVGNIDPGGVFAQLCGTMMLLDEKERDRIGGMIINKFRGDLSILEPGLSLLEEKCGKPVLGVLPYLDVRLEPEDSLAMDEFLAGMREEDGLRREDALDIAVIRLPKISNFTDFQALGIERDVRLRFVSSPAGLGRPDAVILPGTKSTIRDLTWLRESGLADGIRRAAWAGSFLFGICGGYQMLGRRISDPDGAETQGETEGLGYLDMETVFSSEKIIRQTETVSRFGIPALDGRHIAGYEVHMGRPDGEPEPGETGSGSASGAGAAGTYIHGIFDSDEFRGAFLSYLYERRGTKRREDAGEDRITYEAYRERQLAELAAALRRHLDIPAVYRMMGIEA